MDGRTGCMLLEVQTLVKNKNDITQQDSKSESTTEKDLVMIEES